MPDEKQRKELVDGIINKQFVGNSAKNVKDDAELDGIVI